MKVAITRPRERADETIRLIKENGWDVFIVFAMEIVPRPINPTIHLKDYDWLVVTSASGVDVLFNHFKAELKDIDIAVIGPKTNEAFEREGITPKVVALEYVSEGLASELMDVVKGRRLLVARAAIARKVLIEELSKVADVTEIAIYDTLPPTDKKGMKQFKVELEKGELDAVIFTSSRMARNILDFLGNNGKKLLSNTIVCAIGPITAKTLKERGIGVNCVPEKSTIEAALKAIKRAV